MPKMMRSNNQIAQVPSIMEGIPASLKVLITRPKEKAQQLALLLAQQGIANLTQILFDYQPYTSAKDITSAFEHADIIIFVSVAAVVHANAIQALHNRPAQAFFAIGQATKQALLDLGINKIIAPSSNQEHSEGLLALPVLTQVQNKKIVIVRGNGGREHIANTLLQRGAQINYVESYQRVWRTLPEKIALHWQTQQINCIVVTSNEILMTLLKFLTKTSDSSAKYWQDECLWLVVSERLEKNAKALGLTHVINSYGANAEKICATLFTFMDLSVKNKME